MQSTAIDHSMFASEYRGFQFDISNLTGEPHPPCCLCSDRQIWLCFESGKECASFTKYYSDFDV